MAHIKSFGDLGGSGSSDDEGPGDFNEYYAGGEKRCVCVGSGGWMGGVQRNSQ